MKKLMILSVAMFMLAVAGSAQASEASLKTEIKSLKKEESAIKKEKKMERQKLRKLTGKEVSYQSEQAFYADFGNIPVSKWERTNYFDEATFYKDGQVMTAYYDADSKLVGTTSSKTFADIPMNAQKFIDKKYRGYSKDAVVFFDDNEMNETDMIMYEEQFDDADDYFVELEKDNKEIVLRVNTSGEVSFFKQLQ